MPNHFKYEYTLKTGDFDRYKALKPTALLNVLQDISTRHFESVIDNKGEHIWVIVSWEGEIFKQPERMATITVVTRPIYFRKFIAYRHYEVFDEAGDLLARAYSKWAYLDLKTRKQANIPPAFNEAFLVHTDAAAPDLTKIKPFLEPSQAINAFQTFPSDIDVNQHVNNVVYLRWAMDALSLNCSACLALKRFAIAYKREVMLGEAVKVFTHLSSEKDEVIGKQRIENASGETCVLIETTFAP